MPSIYLDVTDRGSIKRVEERLVNLRHRVEELVKAEQLYDKALAQSSDESGRGAASAARDAAMRAKAINNATKEATNLGNKLRQLGAGAATTRKLSQEFNKFQRDVTNAAENVEKMQIATDRWKSVTATMANEISILTKNLRDQTQAQRDAERAAKEAQRTEAARISTFGASATKVKTLSDRLREAGANNFVIGQLTRVLNQYQRTIESTAPGTQRWAQAQVTLNNALAAGNNQLRVITQAQRAQAAAQREAARASREAERIESQRITTLGAMSTRVNAMVASLRSANVGTHHINQLKQSFNDYSQALKTSQPGTVQWAKAQTSLNATLARSQLALRNTRKAVDEGAKSGRAFATVLENIGSAAVLGFGPLSGIGSRIIAIAAIAKRSSGGGGATLGLAGFLAAMVALVKITYDAVAAFSNLESQMSKSLAIMKSTGRIAELTGEQFNNIASSVALNTLASPTQARSALDILVGTGGISADRLKEVLTLSQDLSVVLGRGLSQSARLLGRVLQDPVKNLRSLREAMVQLTPEQEHMIKMFQFTGQYGKAADAILKALKSTVGGAGEGQAVGLAGATDTLSQRWEEFLQRLGNTRIYQLAVESIHNIADALDDLNQKLPEIDFNISPQVRELENHLKLLKDQQKQLFQNIEHPQRPQVYIGRGARPVVIRPENDQMKEAIKLGEEIFQTEKKLIELRAKSASMARRDPQVEAMEQRLTRARADLGLVHQNILTFKTGVEIVSPTIVKLAESMGLLEKSQNPVIDTLKLMQTSTSGAAKLLKDLNAVLIDTGRGSEAFGKMKDNITPLERYTSLMERLKALQNSEAFVRNPRAYREAMAAITREWVKADPSLAVLNMDFSAFSELTPEAAVQLDKATNSIENGREAWEEFNTQLDLASNLYKKGSYSSRQFAARQVEIIENLKELVPSMAVFTSDFSEFGEVTHQQALALQNLQYAVLDTRNVHEQYADQLRLIDAKFKDHVYAQDQVTYAQNEARLAYIDARNAIVDVRQPLEKFNDEMEKLSLNYRNGKITLDQFIKSQKKLKEELFKTDPELKIVSESFEGLMDSISNSIADGTLSIESLKQAFADMETYILKSVTRLAVINPLLNNIFGFDLQTAGQGGASAGMAGGLLGWFFRLFGSSWAGSVGSSIGASGAAFGEALAPALPFQTGGTLRVRGGGFPDSVPFRARVSPGEEIRILTPAQQKEMHQGNVTKIFQFNVNNPIDSQGFLQNKRQFMADFARFANTADKRNN